MKADKSAGFYIAPIYGSSRNLFDNHYALTFAIEPGYSFAWKSRFAMNIGVQYGKTLFLKDFDENEWGPHFGVKFQLGWWFLK